MDVARALLHDPTTDTMRPVRVGWREGRLVVTGEGGVEQEVPPEALRLAPAGSDFVHLCWEREARTWAVSLDAGARQAVEPFLPPALRAALAERARREVRQRRRRRAGYLLLGAFLALPVLAVLVAFLFRERLIDAAVRRLPLAIDRTIGEAVESQVRREMSVIAEGPAHDAVQEIGRRLGAAAGAPSQLQLRFHLVRDSSLNAFAAPGGVIVVHTGLVAAAASPDELAGVLAHEIVHVLERHSLRQIVFRAGVAAALGMLFESPESTAARLAGLAGSLGGLGFSREQERAADRGALALLEATRLPGNGLAAFFDRLAASAEGGGVPALLATHPASEERRRSIEGALAARPAWPVEPVTVDWTAARRDAAVRDPGRPGSPP